MNVMLLMLLQLQKLRTRAALPLLCCWGLLWPACRRLRQMPSGSPSAIRPSELGRNTNCGGPLPGHGPACSAIDSDLASLCVLCRGLAVLADDGESDVARRQRSVLRVGVQRRRRQPPGAVPAAAEQRDQRRRPRRHRCGIPMPPSMPPCRPRPQPPYCPGPDPHCTPLHIIPSSTSLCL